MKNIAFLKHIYYYLKGNNLFTVSPYDSKPLLYWGEEIGHTEMTREEFTALVLLGEVVKIGEL